MNNVQKIFNNSKNSTEFTRGYFDHVANLISKIDENIIGKFIEIILKARDEGRSIYLIGNGGNAATASHFANDIQIGTRPKGKPFKVQSLTDNVAILTAIGNDFGYENIFLKQLEALVNDGDVVIAISTSGNSENIIRAVNYAHERKCTTIGLTGFDGGKLKSIAQFNIHIPTMQNEYGPVEDIQMMINHVIGNYLLLYCQKND